MVTVYCRQSKKWWDNERKKYWNNRPQTCIENLTNHHLQCTLGSSLHCWSHKTIIRTASSLQICIADPTNLSSALQVLFKPALLIPQIYHPHCKFSSNLHCWSHKSIIRTASSLQTCIADSTNLSSALQVLFKSALRIPPIYHPHCKFSTNLQCYPHKSIISTARTSRESIAEARNQAGAMRGRVGSAVQKPENKQEHPPAEH